MKKITKIFSALIVLAMVFVLVTPVGAANTNAHTITINNEKANHVYEAYQVFAGDLSDGKLTNIEWGTGVDTTKTVDEKTLIQAIQAITVNGETPFAAANDAAAVADVLATKNAIAVTDAFAQVVGKYLNTVAGTSSEEKSPYVINVVGDGYYLVKDQDGSVDNSDANDAYTKYILKVVKDVEVNEKSDYPGIDKNIVGAQDGKYNNASVGDTVNFKLTSAVPNMDGYNKYFYVVNDTLSAGLAFNNDVAIKVGDKALVKDTDFTVEVVNPTETDGNTYVTIIFKNFIQYTAGAAIEITYSAIVDEDAVIGTVGNPNTVDLTYSNNPNIDYEGDEDNPDKPGPNEPVGVTPDVTTRTYVTELQINKVDGKDNKTKLDGAVFEITGEKLNKVEVTKETFAIDNEKGTYYKLESGEYTLTAPTEGTESLYTSTTDKYVRVTTREWVTTTETVKAQGVVVNGTLVFTGLSEGTYTITEIKAPDGYNLLKDPTTVTINWTKPAEGSTECTWDIEEPGEKVDGTLQVTIANYSGTTLPETGGMGTTLIYIIGGIMVVGAAVLLIAKKRMEGTK